MSVARSVGNALAFLRAAIKAHDRDPLTARADLEAAERMLVKAESELTPVMSTSASQKLQAVTRDLVLASEEAKR